MSSGEYEPQAEVITLLDEDGGEHYFELIDVIEVDENEYAILVPAPEDEEEEISEAVVLKRSEDDEGNEILVDIEDEEEWEKVASAWEQYVEELDESEEN